jgi:hypothetical protein
MTKTFTPNDVIRYIYQETSEEENQEIEQAFLCDTELLGIYKDYNSIIKQLDAVVKYPSERSTENILKYSRSLNFDSVDRYFE